MLPAMNLLEKPRGRAVLFTLLYLSEGAPMGFIWWALPTLLRAKKFPVDRITGLTALLILPWVFKFLWAPLVDALRTPRFGFRGWIITAQVVMGCALLPLAGLDPAEHFKWWGMLLFLHATAAATQDVAVDALAVHCVPNAERGRINGCMQAGMLLGRSLFAGGTLWLVDTIGYGPVFWALALCIWSSLFLLLLVREPGTLLSRGSGFSVFLQTFAAAFSHRVTWIALAFALSGAASFEATGALLGPFLLDRGVSQEAIGTFLAFPVVAATLVGGLIGGPLSDRWGRARAVGIFLVGFVMVILTVAGADRYGPGPSPRLLMWLLGGMYFFIGLFTASSYALFMDLTNPKLGATQFSTFMAATNGCESWTGRVGGLIAARAGYPAAFLVLCLVSLLSLPLLRKLSPHLNAEESRSTTSP
jgi:MFS transporter, PAT family, beta-lactamase induction signal transducer AmpG